MPPAPYGGGELHNRIFPVWEDKNEVCFDKNVSNTHFQRQLLRINSAVRNKKALTTN
jgi:hypothetical protein